MKTQPMCKFTLLITLVGVIVALVLFANRGRTNALLVRSDILRVVSHVDYVVLPFMEIM